GNYDVGWVDLLGRLGVLGMAVLALVLYFMTRGCWNSKFFKKDAEITIFKRTMATYLLAGLISLPGYPILSSVSCILPFALMTGILAVLESYEAPPGCIQESNGHASEVVSP